MSKRRLFRGPAFKEALCEAQNHRCCYCGKRTNYAERPKDQPTIEHVFSIEQLGSKALWDSAFNLVMACGGCNWGRNDTPINTYLGRIGTNYLIYPEDFNMEDFEDPQARTRHAAEDEERKLMKPPPVEKVPVPSTKFKARFKGSAHLRNCKVRARYVDRETGEEIGALLHIQHFGHFCGKRATSRVNGVPPDRVYETSWSKFKEPL